MRVVVCDTETTGLDPAEGHRVVEIGCVEMVDYRQTGNTFHAYLDPERKMEADAVAVHGLTNDFLRGKPKFADVADGFLDFIGDAPLIAHNAAFDRGFLNAELVRVGRGKLSQERMIDTLAMARQRLPGARNTLDSLCKRYQVSTARRTLHGALLDAQLLAELYPDLSGANDVALDFGDTSLGPKSVDTVRTAGARPTPLAPRLTPEDMAAHAAFIDTKIKNAIWRDYR